MFNRLVLLCSIACVATSCGRPPTAISHTQANHVNWPAYHSFALQNLSAQGHMTIHMRAAVFNQLRHSLQHEMIRKGYQHQQHSAQLLMNISGGTTQTATLHDNQLDRQLHGSLVVQLIDSHSHTIIWQATADRAYADNHGTWSPEKTKHELDAIAREILASVPRHISQ